MRNSWLVLSFVGLLALSLMTLLITFLVRKGLPTVFVLFVLFVLVSVFYGVQIVATGAKPGIPMTPLIMGLLLAVGILSAVGNLALYKAAADSPNPGLVVGILGLQGGLVAALAVYVFKDKLTSLQLFGIALGIVAVAIIGLGARTPKEAKAPEKIQAAVVAEEVSK